MTRLHLNFQRAGFWTFLACDPFKKIYMRPLVTGHAHGVDMSCDNCLSLFHLRDFQRPEEVKVYSI